MKKIGILTSGGDAPGMNAAINAITWAGAKAGVEIRGYQEGYNGLIDNDYRLLEPYKTSHHANLGGTLLGSSRSERFMEPEIREKTVERLRKEGVEGLVVIGGDGSCRGAQALTRLGFPTVAIPGTIDNDIPLTELTLGFKTAISNVIDAIDKIATASASHSFVFVVEVMGRLAGDIALWTGTAAFADAIIATKEDYDLEAIHEKIQFSKAQHKRYQLIVLAEGVASADEFKEEMDAKFGYELRKLALGHIQRGGNPSVDDRILGKLFGERAFEYLHNDEGPGCALGIKENKVSEMDIEEVLGSKNEINRPYQ